MSSESSSSPTQLLSTQLLSCLVWSMYLTYLGFILKVESKGLRLIGSPPLTNTLLFLKVRLHVLAANAFLLKLTPLQLQSLTQELICIFTLSSLRLINSERVFFNLYFLLLTTRTLSRKGYQYTSTTEFHLSMCPLNVCSCSE